jgi:phosphate/sulfate permease
MQGTGPNSSLERQFEADFGALIAGIWCTNCGKISAADLTPAKGASAELVAAILIGSVGFTGLPVSTTQIVILLRGS